MRASLTGQAGRRAGASGALCGGTFMHLIISTLVATAAAASPAAAADAASPKVIDWEPLRKLLSGWEFTTEYAITIGTADGARSFRYESGNFSLKTQIPTGSTSKWPSAMMFASLVDDGTVASLDDPVHKYLDYWTSDPLDPRSEITLRHLLTFTSGFGGGHPGQEFNGRAAREWRKRSGMAPSGPHGAGFGNASEACDTNHGEISLCAKSIYEEVELIGRPGHVYSYNSNHLQLAAGLAVAASGLPIKDVVRKYLLEPYGMTNSYCESAAPRRPHDLGPACSVERLLCAPRALCV